MLTFASTSLSGMKAAQTTLGVSAHNIANTLTPGFHRQQAVQEQDPAGGVRSQLVPAGAPGADLAADMVAQIAAKSTFGANLAVFRTGNEMLGSLLDVTS